MEKQKVYVLMFENGEFVVGGGSSTKPFMRCYDTYESAKRGKSAMQYKEKKEIVIVEYERV
jgi:TATA-box binding protein (TBP) (component of TFIID and TFIIIB)